MIQRKYPGGPEVDPYLGRVCLFGAVWISVGLLCAALLELIGAGPRTILSVFVAVVVLYVLFTGLRASTPRPDVFLVNQHGVPATLNGLANAGGLVSGSVFAGLAASLYLLGHDGLAVLLGLAGGFLLGGMLVAPFVRNLRAASVPEVLAKRFRSPTVRFVAAVLIPVCILPLAVGQLVASGDVANSIFGLNRDVAIIASGALAVICILPGGMRGLTWTQTVLGLVLFSAFLLPIGAYTVMQDGHPFASLSYGGVLQQLPGLERGLILKGLASPVDLTPHLSAFFSIDAVNFVALVTTVALGVAVFPHLVMRYLTAVSGGSARLSAGWSMLFVLVVLLTAPAYAAFVKFDVYSNIAGQLPAALPAWTFGIPAKWGLVEVCGQSLEAVSSALRACGPGPVRLEDVALSRDAVMLASPTIFGLPFFVSALMVAGLLSALVSTAAAVLLAGSTALSHDIYHKLVDRQAPSRRRVAAARIAIVVVGVIAICAARFMPDPFVTMAAWSFSFSASTLFPVFSVGLWWSRATPSAAVLAMLTGSGVCAYYTIGTTFFAPEFFELWRDYSNAGPAAIEAYENSKAAYGAASGATKAQAYEALVRNARAVANWWGIVPQAGAVFGLPAGFITMILVSFLTGWFGKSDDAHLRAMRGVH